MRHDSYALHATLLAALAAIGHIRTVKSARSALKVPPHAAASKRAEARVRSMSASELRATYVEVGVYTRDGRLTRTYGGRAPGGAPRSRKRPA